MYLLEGGQLAAYDISKGQVVDVAQLLQKASAGHALSTRRLVSSTKRDACLVFFQSLASTGRLQFTGFPVYQFLTFYFCMCMCMVQACKTLHCLQKGILSQVQRAIPALSSPSFSCLGPPSHRGQRKVPVAHLPAWRTSTTQCCQIAATLCGCTPPRHLRPSQPWSASWMWPRVEHLKSSQALPGPPSPGKTPRYICKSRFK